MAKTKERVLSKDEVARLETLDKIEQRQERYRTQLLIDKTDLDSLMEEMADLFYRVGEDCEIALSIRDDLKTARDRTYNEVAADLRENPPEGVKVTEGWVKEQTALDERFQLAESDYNQARRVAGLASVMKESMELKSNMLKHLGNLYGAGYFVTTTVQGGRANARDADADAGRAAMAAKRSSAPPLGRKRKE